MNRARQAQRLAVRLLVAGMAPCDNRKALSFGAKLLLLFLFASLMMLCPTPLPNCSRKSLVIHIAIHRDFVVHDGSTHMRRRQVNGVAEREDVQGGQRATVVVLVSWRSYDTMPFRSMRPLSSSRLLLFPATPTVVVLFASEVADVLSRDSNADPLPSVGETEPRC